MATPESITLMKSKNGSLGGDVGRAATYKIKCVEWDFDGFVPLEETTGDGDEGPRYAQGLVYGNISFRGFAISGGRVGLAQLATGNLIDVTLNMDTADVISGCIKVERIMTRWNKRRGTVGLALAGRFEHLMTESGEGS